MNKRFVNELLQCDMRTNEQGLRVEFGFEPPLPDLTKYSVLSADYGQYHDYCFYQFLFL